MASFVGIDIGSVAVKVAVLRTAYRKLQLVGLACVDLAQAPSPEEAVKMAVGLATGGRGAESISTALDGARGAVRVVTLPASVAKQIREVLPFELDSQVPFDMSEVVFDHRVLTTGRNAGTPPEQLQVLVAVAKTEDVRSRIDLVKRAAVHEPERVSVGAFPLANLVPVVPGLADGTACIVDLGQKASELLVVKGGEPVFSRTLSYGTEGLPQSASRLARELRVSLAAYRASGGPAPDRVYLTGGGAFVSGAERFLAGELEVPVEVLQAPAVEIAGVPPELVQQMPRFSKAIGLALGLGAKPLGMNLRKGPLAFERGFAWVREKIPVLAGLAAAILVSFLFSGWAQLYAKGKERDTLEKALAGVTKEVLGEETSSAARAQELLSKQTAGGDEDPMPHADAFDVMVKLSEAIPESMVHDIEELDVQKGHVIVHGIVGSIPDAQAIQNALKNERCFQDVKITRTSQVVGGDRQKYQLELDVKCPEDIKGGKKPAAAGSAQATPSASGGK